MRYACRHTRWSLLLSVAWGTVWLAAAPLAAAAPANDKLIERGAHVYRAGGCASCHTDVSNNGPENGGGVAIESPFGIFYGPNITPDRNHGLGAWNEADFMRALREGVNPAGQHYYPAFPYTSYTRMTDDDMRALWAYLNSRPAVARQNKAHELPWYARFRPVLGLWKWRYFSPGAFKPDPAQSPHINRGAYLVSLAHCGECHTPRDWFGGLQKHLDLAGTPNGPGGVIPNITPDKKTGIGNWSESDLVRYLETGIDPDREAAGDLMAEVIDNGLRYLTKEDLSAIAAYIRSRPPIEHRVRKEKQERN
jgi:mono/diheme cytochrome c family protein